MSLVRLLTDKNPSMREYFSNGFFGKLAGTVLSMVEVAFFFGVVTLAFFVAMSSLFIGIRNHHNLGNAEESAETHLKTAHKYVDDAREYLARARAVAAARDAAKAPPTDATTQPTSAPSDEKIKETVSEGAKLGEKAGKLATEIENNRKGAYIRSDKLDRISAEAYTVAREAEELAYKGRDSLKKIKGGRKPSPTTMPAPPDEQSLGSFFISSPPFFKWSLFKIAVWMWFIQGGLYLLLVTVYWAPGDKGVNENELRALVLMMILTIVVLGIRYWEGVMGFVDTFLRIVGLKD